MVRSQRSEVGLREGEKIREHRVESEKWRVQRMAYRARSEGGGRRSEIQRLPQLNGLRPS